MKLQSILAAAAFVVSTGLTLGANAASDTPADAKAEGEKAPAAKVAAKKKAKPHNHMEEKTGIPVKTTEEKAEPSKKLHDHQRDTK